LSTKEKGERRGERGEGDGRKKERNIDKITGIASLHRKHPCYLG
jgi:hypothetical protein